MVTPDLEPSTRAIAGLTLKNYVRVHIDSIPPQVLEYVKQAVMRVVADPQEPVRGAAGSIITTILSQGLGKWPEVLNLLLQLVDRPESHVVEVCAWWRVM